jgi:error-prone DNA polymerase
VVFISVDDGTGCVDASFFTEAQHETGEMLFSARLMLIEGTTRRTGPKAISLQAIRAWDLHRPETLPDPDYLDSSREEWRAWLRRDRSAAHAGGTRQAVPWGPGARHELVDAGGPNAGSRAPAGARPGAPRDIPHHDTGDWPVTARGAVGLPPESSATGGDRRGAGLRELDLHRPVPVPHPETWELLPTPED